MRIAVTTAVLIAMLLSGCTPHKTKPAPKPASGTISNTDPCGTRLHDICGPLLLYYATHHRLPETLQVLEQLPHDEQLEFTCPLSHQAYIYDPSGLLNSPNGRLIVFDPTPAHAGFRWAIAAVEGGAGSPLVLKVVALRESFFAPGADALRPQADSQAR